MSKDEIKREINEMLDRLSDKSLEELFRILKGAGPVENISLLNDVNLGKLLQEDKVLLQNLAK